LAGGAGFGSGVGFGAADGSSFARAERSGSRRGAGGNLSVSMAPDGRFCRGELVVREVNCRHDPDIIGRHLSSKERGDMPGGASGRDVLERALSQLGEGHPGFERR
jgi:hypothetical protein